MQQQSAKHVPERTITLASSLMMCWRCWPSAIAAIESMMKRHDVVVVVVAAERTRFGYCCLWPDNEETKKDTVTHDAKQLKPDKKSWPNGEWLYQPITDNVASFIVNHCFRLLRQGTGTIKNYLRKKWSWQNGIANTSTNHDHHCCLYFQQPTPSANSKQRTNKLTSATAAATTAAAAAARTRTRTRTRTRRTRTRTRTNHVPTKRT